MERTWCKSLPAADLLLSGGRVVDPASGLDGVTDVLIAKGRIAGVGDGLEGGRNTRVVDASDMLVLPGFVDLHAHFRTPGREDEEDLATGSAAAATGGYVAAFGMANTDPVTDSAPLLRGLAEQAGTEAVIPLGFWAAVTCGLAGEQLTEMGELGEAGAVGFSDDGKPLPTSALTRRALQYVKVSGRFVGIHAQDDSLFKGGQMHEGPASARLGLTGIPSLCESLDVSRSLDVCAYEDAHLHVHHVSTEASLEAIARAKAAGVKVTIEATPHHLTMNDEAVASLDPNLKMNPPLRAESDRQALVAALRSGLVDCVATDHAPHASEEKDVPYRGGAVRVHRPGDRVQRALRRARRAGPPRSRHAGDTHEHSSRRHRRPHAAGRLRRRSRRPLRSRSPRHVGGHPADPAVPFVQLAVARQGAHGQGQAHSRSGSCGLGRPCLARPSSSSRTGPCSTARLSPAAAPWAARSCSTRACPATRRSPPTRPTAGS